MTTDHLVDAVLARAAAILEVPAPTDVDPALAECSFFAEGGLSIDGHVLDSLDLVDLMTALEEELSVDLLSIEDESSIDSLAKVAEVLRAQCAAADLDIFTAQWAPRSILAIADAAG